MFIFLPVSRLQAFEWEDSLTQHFVVVVENCKPQHGKLGQDHLHVYNIIFFDKWLLQLCVIKSVHLSEAEWFFVVDGIEAVGWHDFCPVLFSDGVGWQAIHVHLHIGTDFFV